MKEENKMGLKFEVGIGTGRAFCKLCNKPIKAEQKCIRVYGYQTGGQCHANAKDCKELRKG